MTAPNFSCSLSAPSRPPLETELEFELGQTQSPGVIYLPPPTARLSCIPRSEIYGLCDIAGCFLEGRRAQAPGYLPLSLNLESRGRRDLNIRNALRSSNSRRPRRASFALFVVSVALLGGGGATIIQVGSDSTFFVTLGLAFCQPTFGPHLCHPGYMKHPFIYRLLVFFCSVVLDSHTLGASPEKLGPEYYPRLALC